MSDSTPQTHRAAGVRLTWRHHQLESPPTGPTEPGLGRRSTDYLAVTNSGDAEATTLTLVVIPLNGSPIALCDAPEPLDLPAGRSASWALLRTAVNRGRTHVISVAAYWFEDDQEHSGHWDVTIGGRW
ncbi:hypothetical protein [Solicola sp. PLA-1-18]|uniref:hypothetical protein n=1 Tax=Solicola sp. PLA-1-18 TaxID=3380532 RepID=UPI003B78DB55